MAFLIVAALIGLLPANIAKNKGYSFVGWWIYGALLFIVALPHALMMKNAAPTGPAPGWYPHKDGCLRMWDGKAWTESGRKCERCAEIIKVEAQVCRYCGSAVEVKP